MRHEQRRCRALLLGGAAACLVAIAALAVAPEAALRAWLAASLLWTALPIGAVGLLMMMRLIPGAWSSELAIFAEAGCLLLPFAALLLLPVLAGMGGLYAWVRQPPVAGFQAAYLTPWFFVARSVVWLALLAGLSWLLVVRRRGALAVAVAGMVAYVLFASAIATDWVMSLDRTFHSSGFGLYLIAHQIGASLAAMVLAALLLRRRLRDPGLLGGLLLTVLLLWAYLAFMQYFIIWSGNFVDGVRWYGRRGSGGWAVLAWTLALLQLGPLLLLLIAPLRRHAGVLLALALAVLLGKALESAWLVLPGIGAGVAAMLLFGLALAGQGAIVAAAYPVALRHRVARRRLGPARP